MADLLMLKFEGSYEAQKALSEVRALDELPYAWIDEVAVVERHKGGLVALHSAHGSALRGAFYGSLIGLLLFWWFPPAWFLGGWLGGLGGGALIGEAMKRTGIDEKLVDEVKSELTPDTSALFFIGVSSDADEMVREFEEHHPVSVVRHTLSESTLEILKKEVGSPENA
jgi:uncharacterized membrane protein